jgi:hypothetical protein
MRGAWMVCVLFSILTSCDPGVEIDNIPPHKLLYVHSTISPGDSSLKVYVFRASGLSERIPFDSLVEKNARVTISDGTNAATLQYYAYMTHYEGINIFKNAADGTRFTLTITTPDAITVVGHTVLPPKPKLIAFKYDFHNQLLIYNLMWDNPEAHKYFQAWMSFEGPVIDGRGNTSFMKNSTNLPLEPGIHFWERQPKGINSLADSIPIYPHLAGPAKVNFTLANMEESIWKYEKTFAKYDSWLSNAEESSIIPVFTEPAQVYSNITGGFGIFASFNSTDSLTITIAPDQ